MINKISKRIEGPNHNKSMRKISSESRKDGNEIDVITSENTPKSHNLNYKLPSLDRQASNNHYQNEEKSKERVFDIVPIEKYDKPSPLTARYNKVSDCMNRFKKFKDEIYEQSPMPCLPFLKRDSSIGEEGLIYPTQCLDLTDHKDDMLNTPKQEDMNSKSNLISLCLKSSVNPRFSNNNNDQVLEDDDMEEPPVIREFSLIPHQHDEELSDNEVEQNKTSNDNNRLNASCIIDSINEIFENHGLSLLDQCNQPKKVLKRNKKIHKKNIDCCLNKNSEIRIKIAKISDSIERARVSKPQVVSEIKHSPASKK